MRASDLRLYVNIDHVATVRQARRGDEPDPVAAAALCESAGADGITAHLREDRRHVQDEDIERLRARVRALTFECACTDEMVNIALRVRPEQVTFVPEGRQEITTEGGLDVQGNATRIERAVIQLKRADIRTTLFVDPNSFAIDWAHRVGAQAIELHTGDYAQHPDDPATANALRDAAHHAAALGLEVHAGHGLTARNLAPIAAIEQIEELHIGHSIISRSIFVGLVAAVREVREAMDAVRHAS